MWQSLKEYISSLGKWGWVVLVGVIGAIAGLGLDISGVPSLPIWVWLIILVLVLMIAPFLAFHKLRLKRDELQRENKQLKTNLPYIELGDPQLHDERFLPKVLMGKAEEVFTYSGDPIDLYRIPIHNTGASTPAVVVRLVNVTPSPPIELPNPILHRTGDNPIDWVGYQKSFPLGKDETEYVDVIAQAKQPPHDCYIWRVDFPHAVQAIKLSGDYVLTIGVYAGDFSKEQDYDVHVNAVSGILRMTRR